MTDCDECLEPIKWGEKVSSGCQGRRLSQNIKLEIDFFHAKCCDREEELKTISEWKKHWQEVYRR